MEGPDPKTDTRDLSPAVGVGGDDWFMIDGGDENIIWDQASGGFWYSLWRDGDVEMVKVVKKEFLLPGGERKVFFLSRKDLGVAVGQKLGVAVGQNLIDKKDKTGLDSIGD